MFRRRLVLLVTVQHRPRPTLDGTATRLSRRSPATTGVSGSLGSGRRRPRRSGAAATPTTRTARALYVFAVALRWLPGGGLADPGAGRSLLIGDWWMSPPIELLTVSDQVLLADLVGLTTDLLGRRSHEVSDGQLQRACLARALAPAPGYLICDEMTTMLDASTTAA